MSAPPNTPPTTPPSAGPRSLLIDRIGHLTTHDHTDPAPRTDAAIVLEDGLVVWIGTSADAPATDARHDVQGRAVIPGFVDSHSHLVFAGDRSAEFEARMTGHAYAAGGIRITVAATRAADTDVLEGRARRLVDEMHAQGTTTIEIKSGYGLDVETEARCLQIASRLTPETTFLGAHVVPAEYAGRADDYVDLVTGPMLAACAPHARWIDVFCETGAFDLDQSRRILEAGRDAGLGMRLHAAQLGPSPAVRMGVELGVASIDHGTFLTDADLTALAGSDTVLTMLPGAEFSTRQPFPDARRAIDAGVTLALATDCNPGSSFTSSMPFVIALAVRHMGLSPAEALWAATSGGGAALRRPLSGPDAVGRIQVGGPADLVVLEAPNPIYLAYRPGVPLVHAVYVAGERRAIT